MFTTRGGRSEWLISMLFFAAILLALVIAALLLDPLALTLG
jgi:hypothetical protein